MLTILGNAKMPKRQREAYMYILTICTCDLFQTSAKFEAVDMVLELRRPVILI